MMCAIVKVLTVKNFDFESDFDSNQEFYRILHQIFISVLLLKVKYFNNL